MDDDHDTELCTRQIPVPAGVVGDALVLDGDDDLDIDLPNRTGRSLRVPEL